MRWREPDAALQQSAERVRAAVLGELLAGGILINVEAGGETPQAPAPRRPTCLTVGCQRPTEARGLCAGCYQRAVKPVAKKATTWEELERAGRALAATR